MTNWMIWKTEKGLRLCNNFTRGHLHKIITWSFTGKAADDDDLT